VRSLEFNLATACCRNFISSVSATVCRRNSYALYVSKERFISRRVLSAYPFSIQKSFKSLPTSLYQREENTVHPFAKGDRGGFGFNNAMVRISLEIPKLLHRPGLSFFPLLFCWRSGLQPTEYELQFLRYLQSETFHTSLQIQARTPR